MVVGSLFREPAEPDDPFQHIVQLAAFAARLSASRDAQWSPIASSPSGLLTAHMISLDSEPIAASPGIIGCFEVTATIIICACWIRASLYQHNDPSRQPILVAMPPSISKQSGQISPGRPLVLTCCHPD